MISDRDIWASAKIMIGRYGETAPVEASARADELRKAGDLAGCRVWTRILDAIGALQAAGAGESRH